MTEVILNSNWIIDLLTITKFSNHNVRLNSIDILTNIVPAESDKNTEGIAKKVLEVGSGPVPIYVISASQWTDWIVCSDFLEQNRQKLTDWLSAGRKADETWLSYARYVAKLESEK